MSPEDDFEGKGRSSRHSIDLPAKDDVKAKCMDGSSIHHPVKHRHCSPSGKTGYVSI